MEKTILTTILPNSSTLKNGDLIPNTPSYLHLPTVLSLNLSSSTQFLQINKEFE